jgi:nicotinate-nucleotide adenylyltransferase
VVPIPGVDISAAELRARVRAGRPIRYLTPPAVEQYIQEKGLYRLEPSASSIARIVPRL